MKVKDPRYDYHITVSAHIIIENDKREILMGKRPDNWEWAPGRWGLFGGKIYEHESMEETIKRKTKQELGFEIKPEGLYKIEQLIIADKQAYMYFFVAKYSGQKIEGALAEYRWLGKKDFDEKPANNFGEYFYKKMLGDFLSSTPQIFPVDKIQSLNYIVLGETPDYKQWFKGIINKDYRPEVIPDFKVWKKQKSV